MARGAVVVRRRAGTRPIIFARVESKGVVVWRDNGYRTIAEAMTNAAAVAAAFTLTGALGQHHISWDQVVDEAEDL